MLFRMTQRLRDWLKVADTKLLRDNAVQAESNKEWYGNLLVLHRRKCLLFTHSTSLFSFLIAGVRQADARDFGNLFRLHATGALAAEGMATNQIAYLLDAGPDQIGKTENRSVLGSMKDFAHMCRFYASQVSKFEQLSLDEINQAMNASLMSYLAMESATRTLRHLLKSASAE
jgi:hypothetical protein